MGYVENWSGLMTARWFLGMAEAGLYPGVNYFLSCWYKRSEFGVRAVSTIILHQINILTLSRPSSFQLQQSRDLSEVSSQQRSRI
jgi:MFS family permease